MKLLMQMQNQYQQQKIQQIQVQQQQQIQQLMEANVAIGRSGAQMFLQGSKLRSGAGAGPNLQGPLAYLEKTAINMELVDRR